MGILQLWMVFVAGIILGVGGAFFGPAVMSVLPKMVPKDKLTNANSFLEWPIPVQIFWEIPWEEYSMYYWEHLLCFY